MTSLAEARSIVDRALDQAERDSAHLAAINAACENEPPMPSLPGWFSDDQLAAFREIEAHDRLGWDTVASCRANWKATQDHANMILGQPEGSCVMDGIDALKRHADQLKERVDAIDAVLKNGPSMPGIETIRYVENSKQEMCATMAWADRIIRYARQGWETVAALRIMLDENDRQWKEVVEHRKASAIKQIAQAQEDGREEVRSQVGSLVDELLDALHVSIPEKNCSCCVAPPCNDCVEWGGARSVMETLNDVLRTAYPATKEVPRA